MSCRSGKLGLNHALHAASGGNARARIDLIDESKLLERNHGWVAPGELVERHGLIERDDLENARLDRESFGVGEGGKAVQGYGHGRPMPGPLRHGSIPENLKHASVVGHEGDHSVKLALLSGRLEPADGRRQATDPGVLRPRCGQSLYQDELSSCGLRSPSLCERVSRPDSLQTDRERARPGERDVRASLR